jgi:hypothetical protein
LTKLNSIFLSVAAIIVSCSSGNDVARHQEENLAKPIDTLFYELEKTYVTGDFDGDGIIDTLFERNISQLTGEEIVRIPMKPGGDFYDDVDFMNQQKSKLFMSWNKTNRDTLHLEHGFNLLLCLNLGDVNKDGNDELALMVNDFGISSVENCRIFSYCQNQWKELLKFSVFASDAYLNANFNAYQVNKGFLYKEGENWYYYDFYESLIDLTEKHRGLMLKRCDGRYWFEH